MDNLVTEDMIYLREMEPAETASDYLNKYIKAEIIPLANNTIADLKAELASLNTEIANLRIELAKKERDQAESAVLKTNIEVRASLEEMRQAISGNKFSMNSTSTPTNDYEINSKLDKIIEGNEDIQKTLSDVNSKLNDNNKIEAITPNNISNIYPEANLVTNVEPAPAEIQNISTPVDESTPVEETNQEVVPNEIPSNEEVNNVNEEVAPVNEVTEEKEMVSAGVNPEDRPQYDLPTNTIKPEGDLISSIPSTEDNNQVEENVAQAEGNNNIYPEGSEENATNEIQETNNLSEENKEVEGSVPQAENNGPQVESVVEATPAIDGEPLSPTGTKIGRSALEEVKKDTFVVKTSDVGEEVSHFPQELKDRLDGLLGITKEEKQGVSMKRAA